MNKKAPGKENNPQKIETIKSLNKLSFYQRLLSFFGAKINKDSDTYNIEPGNQFKKDAFNYKSKSDSLEDIINQAPLSNSIKELYKDWASDVQIGYDNFEERLDRVNALTFLYCNDSYIKSAANLTATEASKTSSSEVFTVSSGIPEWDKATNALINQVWNTKPSTIYDIAFQLYLYSDAFIGNEVNSAGVVNRKVLRPNDILEKLEFDPIRLADFKNSMKPMKGGGFSAAFNKSTTSLLSNSLYSTQLNFNQQQTNSYKSRSDLLKDFLENLADNSNNEIFSNHILGYRIAGEQLLAPWQVSHLRLGENSSEFFPYGCPLLLPCVSLHLQEQRLNGLEDIRKRLSLPLITWEVETGSENMSRAFQLVNTAKQRYENLGLDQSQTDPESLSLTNNIWTAKGLVTVSKSGGESASNSSLIDELKRLDDKKIACTLVPKSYIDPGVDNFQMSGVALMQLYAPYRDMIETLRNLIIEDYRDAIELHYAILGEEVPDYTLTLNVVNPADDQALSTKLELANNILDKVAIALGVEVNQLPKEIKIDILQRFGGLDSKSVATWDSMLKELGKEESTVEVSEEQMVGGLGYEPDSEMQENSLNSKNHQELLEAYSVIKSNSKTSNKLSLEILRSVKRLETTNKIITFVGGSNPQNKFNDSIQFFRKENNRKLNEEV